MKLPEILKTEPMTLYNQATDFLEKKNAPDSALYALTTLVSIAEYDPKTDFHNSIYTVAYATRGAIFASVYGNYSEAAQNFLKALDLARRNSDEKWINRIGYNLTAMEYEQGRLTDNPDISKRTVKNFSDILRRLDIEEDRDLMEPLILSVLEIALRENIKNKDTDYILRFPHRDKLAGNLQDLLESISLFNSGETDKALELINSTLTGGKTPSSVMEAGTQKTFLVIKAHMLLKAGKEKEALDTYNMLRERCEQENELFTVFENYRFIKDYFLTKGDFEKAGEFELKEYHTKDDLINRSGMLSLDGSRALYNEKKLQRDIEAEISRNREYRTIVYVSVSFIILLLLFFFLLYRKYQQLNKSHNIIVRNDRDYFKHTSLKAADGPGLPVSEEQAPAPSLYDRILEIAQNHPEIYDENFNTGRLAELVGEKPAAVSAAIADATGDTTSQFIARVRVREACRRFNDKVRFGDYTIEAIGQSVGYRSRSHFGSVFKKIIGMTPSEYSSKIR